MDYKMTIFNEQLVKVKQTVINIISLIFLYVAAIGIVITAFLFLFGTEYSMFLALIVVGVIIGLWYLTRFYSIEYEYSLTNGCLDIDKIYARSTRKQYITLNMKTLEEMALITTAGAKEKVYAIPRGKVYNCSSNANPYGTYYAIFNTKKQGKICLLFEPNDKMMEGIRLFARGKIKEDKIHISEGK